MQKEIVAESKARMDKTVESVKHELAAIRTGKASVNLLETVRVESYGQQSPLNQVASVSAPDAHSLVVQPWDKSLIGDIVKAIQQEDLGLNPQVEGEVVRVPVPPLNEERRRDLVRLAKKVAEDGKVALRNIRRDANDNLKKLEKDKDITSDLMHDAMNDVQKVTDGHCETLDALVNSKEKEVMSV